MAFRSWSRTNGSRQFCSQQKMFCRTHSCLQADCQALWAELHLGGVMHHAHCEGELYSCHK